MSDDEAVGSADARGKTRAKAAKKKAPAKKKPAAKKPAAD